MRMLSALMDLRVLVLVVLGVAITVGTGTWVTENIVSFEAARFHPPTHDVSIGAPVHDPDNAGPGGIERVGDREVDTGWDPPAWLVAGGLFATICLFGVLATSLMWSRAAAGDEPDPPEAAG